MEVEPTNVAVRAPALATPTMSWAALFERAESCEVDVEDVREALATRRETREQARQDSDVSAEERNE